MNDYDPLSFKDPSLSASSADKNTHRFHLSCCQQLDNYYSSYLSFYLLYTPQSVQSNWHRKSQDTDYIRFLALHIMCMQIYTQNTYPSINCTYCRYILSSPVQLFYQFLHTNHIAVNIHVHHIYSLLTSCIVHGFRYIHCPQCILPRNLYHVPRYDNIPHVLR